jgi:hypothetical protein
MKVKRLTLPASVRNWVSIWGALLASVSLFFIIFLFLISVVFDVGSSYLGIFIYIILPIFLVAGLIMIPVGMYITRKKMKKMASEKVQLKWPTIDFNNPAIRNAAMIFGIGTLVFLLLTSIGSYEAFHYTESVEFCGKLCHKVMEPEYTAYHQSSHERVKCVECHVGSGANWYVKSKLSGLYQVYSVTFNKYPRPIPTPVHNLRPARETCEQCHWPQKFYDRKMKMKRLYLADDTTTEWDVNLLMKTSATFSALGQQEGIHWHINPDVKIEYRLNPSDKESIPWVKFTNRKTGESHIYKDMDSTINEKDLQLAEVKTMDCMDCHNRPSHNYLPPQNFVDDAITSGAISRKLPDIKIIAMQVFGQDYSTKDSAFMAIDTQIKEYYKLMYPDILEPQKDEIQKAIKAIQEGYSRNIFPAMKVKWDAYPLHLGHLETNGCYRCHNDKHKSDTGRVISRNCNLCHSILAQGTPGKMEYSTSMETLQFHHPVNINDAWKTKLCSECHHKLY